jgi:hypothetical protein
MPDKSVLFPTLGLIFCFTLAAQDPPDRFYWETLQYQYPELHGQELPAVWLLGWGPQGKVGFVMEAEEGAFVKVFDLVEDQVLFLQDFPGLSGREIWDQQVDLIRDLRERFGLQASDRQPTVYPFLHQGRYYQILQRAQRDALGQSFLSYDLVLKATGLGEKNRRFISGALGLDLSHRHPDESPGESNRNICFGIPPAKEADPGPSLEGGWGPLEPGLQLIGEFLYANLRVNRK